MKSAFPSLRPERQFLIEALRSSLSFPPSMCHPCESRDPVWDKLHGESMDPRLKLAGMTHLLESFSFSSFDWDYLFQIAEIHGVLPLLYSSLTPSPFPLPVGERGVLIPEEFRNKLRNVFEENALRNLRLTQELLELLALLESQGIPAIPFKGPLLAQSIYGNLALRQFRDLDILVHKKDVKKAKELLMGEGYRLHHELTPLEEAMFLKHDCEFIFVHDEGKAVVEIHWDFAPKYFSAGFDLDKIWKRSIRVNLFGRTVSNLSAEDSLLMLCVHGAKHRWSRLQWICDAAKLIRAYPELDWQALYAEARQMGCGRILGLGLFLAADLFGAALPDFARTKIKADREVSHMAESIYQNLFLESYSRPGVAREFHRFGIKVRERFRDQCLYVFRIMTIPTLTDLRQVKLPESLAFLYAWLRPFQILIRSLLAKIPVSEPSCSSEPTA